MRAALTRADRQARTRDDLIEAADQLFTANGFHTTSLDAIADAAGYTKGAVYSNFSSKEDLFLAVYSRRVDRRIAEMEATLSGEGTAYEGLQRLATALGKRRDDGWLAVFFEFWAHVLRHAELRERFVEHHRRGLGPVVRSLEEIAAERGQKLPEDSRKLATARLAMVTGLQLERLIQPDLVDEGLALRIVRITMDEGGPDGLPDQATAGPRTRRASEQGAARS